MSEGRPEKRKIEMIESYWTGGEYGSDYKWDDNHGELVRCKYCRKHGDIGCPLWTDSAEWETDDDWFCADGERR